MNRIQAGVFSLIILSAAIVALGPGVSSLAIPHSESVQAPRSKPNFIVVLCDDLGYGDVQPYRRPIPPPPINRLAREGLLATAYYTPGNICTPSRAGLLTGRYPVRTGLGYEVILAGDDRTLPLSEKTIAALL